MKDHTWIISTSALSILILSVSVSLAHSAYDENNGTETATAATVRQEAKHKWHALNQEMIQAYRAGNYDKAIPLAKEALNFAEKNFGSKHPSTLIGMNNQAALYESLGLYELAESLYVKTLVLRKEVLGEKHPDTLTSINNLAGLYQSQGRYGEAETLYVVTLALRKEVLGERHPDTRTTMSNLAELYHSQGHYKQAESLSLAALALSRELLGEKHPDTLITMDNLAGLYHSQGRYEQAEQLYVTALALSKEVLGEIHPDTRITMSNLAGLYHSQGRYEQAEPLYATVLRLNKEVLSDKNPSTLISMNNLAGLYHSQGRYEQAEPLYASVLRLSKEVLGDKHPSTLTSMNNLAMLYNSQGRYEQAELLYVAALALTKEVLGEKHPDTLSSINNLAELYSSQGHYGQAEPLYVKALSLRQDILGEKHPSTLISMDNLAGLYRSQGRHAQAATLYVAALALSKEILGKRHPDTLIAMNNLATLYYSQGHHELAEPLTRQALAISKEVLGERHPATLLTMTNLAMLYVTTDQHTRAEALYDELMVATDAFLHQVLWGAGEQTRKSYIQQQSVIKNYFLTYFSRKNRAENALRTLSLSLSRKGLLLQIATQVKAIARSSKDPALKSLSESLKDNRRRLSASLLSGANNKEAIHALQEQVNQQQAELGLHIQQLQHGDMTVTPEQVVAALTGGRAFVDYLIYQQINFKTNKYLSTQLLALVVNPAQTRAVKLIPLGAIAPIEEEIGKYRSAMKRGGAALTVDERTVAQQLYQRLWLPLLPHLGDNKQVYVAPDGVLNLLPLASLIDGEGNYLAQNHQLTILSSGRDLVLPALEGNTTAPVIVSAPLYAPEQMAMYQNETEGKRATTTGRSLNGLYFSPLPGALREGKALYALMKKKAMLATHYNLAAATEPQVAAVTSPRILHLATHGFFLNDLPVAANDTRITERGFKQLNPVKKRTEKSDDSGDPLLRSGLAFANANLNTKAEGSRNNGILTADEVLDMQLAGTELVVLSACETGLGDIKTGEGVYGLRRAFQEAGARAVMSTLWSVSDEVTQHFMGRFYQRFLSGMGAQQALRETQDEFMRSDKWSNPYYWAPFVMVGKG